MLRSYIIHLVLFLMPYSTLMAQPMDSLQQALNQSQGEDRLKALEQLAYFSERPTDIHEWALKLLAEAEKQEDLYYQALAHHHVAS